MIHAKIHPKITNLREFVETFAYKFQNGANAEISSGSKHIFRLFLDILDKSQFTYRKELGGHSPVWALRA